MRRQFYRIYESELSPYLAVTWICCEVPPFTYVHLHECTYEPHSKLHQLTIQHTAIFLKVPSLENRILFPSFITSDFLYFGACVAQNPSLRIQVDPDQNNQ